MAANKPPKKAPAKKAGAKRRPKRFPLGSMPLPKGESTDLTNAERDWLTSEVDRIEGLEATIKALAPDDFEQIKQGLGASIGFSNLQRITRDIEGWTSIDEREEWYRREILYYLRIAQTGYKLAMSIANTALGSQHKLVADALKRLDKEDELKEKARERRWNDDPTQIMKRKIKSEWENWQANRALYRRPGDFRQEMIRQHPTIVDGTLKNWMTKWGRERLSRT